MCAIFGWLDYKGIVNSKVLNKLTQSLANAAEERGTDAAGISYVYNKRITIYKRPRPAHKIKFKVPQGTKAVMGHTRFATQGAKELNYNNHPFKGVADVPFALAHNGVLYNDSTLKKTHKLPATGIETDSYVAVQLIEDYGTLNMYTLRTVAEEVKGTFNFTILDVYNNLYIVKGSNPITILHYEALGLYIYASTDTIIEKALKKSILLNFACKKVKALEGDIIKIDRDGEVTKSKFTPKSFTKFDYYCNLYDWYDDTEESQESDEYELLYDYARMNGIDDYIVDELLEYGYSPMDVEELIYDTEQLDVVLKYIRGDFNDYARI